MQTDLMKRFTTVANNPALPWAIYDAHGSVTLDIEEMIKDFRVDSGYLASLLPQRFHEHPEYFDHIREQLQENFPRFGDPEVRGHIDSVCTDIERKFRKITEALQSVLDYNLSLGAEPTT